MTHIGRVARGRFHRLITRHLPGSERLGDIAVIYEHLPPHTALPRVHHRRTGEFIYCTSGAMTAYLGDKRYRIRTGSIVYLPPKVRHRFVTGKQACEAISIFHPHLAIAPGADIHTD
ncbi:MAG: cupin domain-containing protein [Elusimicrobiota bacterium]